MYIRDNDIYQSHFVSMNIWIMGNSLPFQEFAILTFYLFINQKLFYDAPDQRQKSNHDYHAKTSKFEFFTDIYLT